MPVFKQQNVYFSTKEKINNRAINDFSGDKQAKEKFDQEEREKSLSEKEKGEGYSFTKTMKGKKLVKLVLIVVTEAQWK